MVSQKQKAAQIYERKRQRCEENSRLSGEEGFQKVREATLKLLDYKDYSSGDLMKKLREKGYPLEIITPVIQRFEELGLINDYSYARALLRNKFESKGLVGVALRADLMHKSISADIIDRLLQEIDDSELLAKAEELVQKKLRSMLQIDFQKQRNRLVSMLLRKGYPYSISHEVVDHALEIYQGEE